MATVRIAIPFHLSRIAVNHPTILRMPRRFGPMRDMSTYQLHLRFAQTHVPLRRAEGGLNFQVICCIWSIKGKSEGSQHNRHLPVKVCVGGIRMAAIMKSKGRKPGLGPVNAGPVVG